MKIVTALVLTFIAPTTSFLVPTTTTTTTIIQRRCTLHNNNNHSSQSQRYMTTSSNEDDYDDEDDYEEELDTSLLPTYNPPPTDAAGAELSAQFSALLSSWNITTMDDLEEEDVSGAIHYREDGIQQQSQQQSREDVKGLRVRGSKTEQTQQQDTEDANDYMMNSRDIEIDMNLDDFDIAEIDTDILPSDDEISAELGSVEIDYDLEELEEEEVYVVPTKVPDEGLTAGEVVTLVVTALRNNDDPTPNKGIEIFFGYSSPISQVRKEIDKGMTPQQYKDFLLFSKDYANLFDNDDLFIEKGDVNYSTKKAYYTIRLLHHDRKAPDLSVNFILSTEGGEGDPWLIDSMLIRPSLRRNLGRR